MANPEHLAILKQGVEVWNRWSEENPDVVPDLSEADLTHKNLVAVDFYNANLNSARLGWANLTRANLSDANLNTAYLGWADLKQANLCRADLSVATIRDANLSHAFLGEASLANADLAGADCRGSNLYGANLTGADLPGVTFKEADLADADLSNVWLLKAIFSDTDLSTTKGLSSIQHLGPSTIGIDTIIKSKGQIPKKFLRGCGVPEEFIDYIPSLLSQPIQYYSCFISYSSKDQEFCERLHADLQNHGVRCWFAPEDLKIGDRIRHAIDLSIRHHDKLMLVLSEQSIASQWVEKEVETAFEKERQHGKTVLFPLMLDRTVFDTAEAWAADIRRTRHIGDFTNWKNHDDYKKALDRLLRDLKADE